MSKLPNDADLFYIVDNCLVNKPSEWMRSVYENLRESQKSYGPSCVRIGLSGTGHSPNYRIEPIEKPNFEEMSEQFNQAVFNGVSNPMSVWRTARNTAFDGRSHKKTSRLQGLNDENWSRRTTNEQEIQEIRKRFRSQPSI